MLKRCVSLVLVLAPFIVSLPSAWAAISRVQFCSNASNGAATSIACTMSSNTTTGNMIAVCVSSDSSTESDWSSISDGTNSYTYRTATWTTGYLKLGDAVNITGLTTPTITANFASSVSFRGIVAVEYSGVSVNPFDQATAANQTDPGTGTDAVTTGSVTTTQNDELLFGCAATVFGTITYTPGTNFTEIVELGSGTSISAEERFVSSTGSYAATWTASSETDDWTRSLIATYKALTAVEGCYLMENNTDKYALEGGDGGLCGAAPAPTGPGWYGGGFF